MSEVELQLGEDRVRVSLPVLSAQADLTLHPPDLVPIDGSTLAQWATLQVGAAIREAGHAFTRAQFAMLRGSPDVLLALHRLRADQLKAERDRGRCALDCPHCQAATEFDLAGLWISTTASPPPVRDRDGWPVPPALAHRFAAGSPPDGPCATRAVLTLPVSEQTAVMSTPIDPQQEALAWPCWEAGPDGSRRQRSNPGFRAILRASLALDELAGAPADPPGIERLPAPDVLFIDACYQVLFASVIPPERGRVTCSECGQAYITALTKD